MVPRQTVPVILLALLVLLWPGARLRAQVTVSTTISISICGNGQVEHPEVCDDGPLNGVYGAAPTDRHCAYDCNGYAPYCGDGILQPLFGEECDSGANNSANGACSPTCKLQKENIPPSGGGGGGGGNYNPGSPTPAKETKVVVTGKAYPNASVNILKDGETIGIVQADAMANFYFATTNISPGVATFGFWAQDTRGLKSVSFTTTLTVVPNAITTVSGAYLPPTISIDKKSVKRGDTVTISGTSIPSTDIYNYIHSNQQIVKQVKSDSSGVWKLGLDTSALQDNDFHTVQAAFQSVVNGVTVKSEYSQALSFYVGNKTPGKSVSADLNHDGRVNLADFSILLYYWGTSNSTADLNGDGKVNLTDFSVMMYYWTG